MTHMIIMVVKMRIAFFKLDKLFNGELSKLPNGELSKLASNGELSMLASNTELSKLVNGELSKLARNGEPDRKWRKDFYRAKQFQGRVSAAASNKPKLGQEQHYGHQHHHHPT